jgi:hypothetical protein
LLAFTLAGLLVAPLVERMGTFQGTQVAFAVDALSYLVSALLLVRLPLVRHLSEAAREPLSRLPSQVLAGLRFVLDNPWVRANTVLLTFGPLMLGSLHTLWIGFAWRVSNTGTFGYGVTETANAVGTLTGLLMLSRVSRRTNPGRVILLGLAIMGSAVAAAGLTDSLALVTVLAAICGVGNMLFLVPSITLVQRQTPSALRGRVFAVRLMLTFGAFAISNAIAGVLSDVVGVSPLMLVFGGGMLLLAVCASFAHSAREAV